MMSACFQDFRALIEHSPDAVSVIDARGDILYGSASTTKIFGYQPEELVGRNCLELIHPADRDHSRRALKEVLAKSGPLQWDARILNKDGTYSWVESTISSLLPEAEVQAIVVHQRNIDGRKGEERERMQRAEELARSNERLEEFAYTAAHDLREPLRAISAYTEILIQDAQLDTHGAQMAKFIVDGAKRMSILIDDLLSFATTGMVEPSQYVDLERVLVQATLNLEIDIKTGGATVMLDYLPAVRGNEIQLIRLFQNLIGNAVKYRGREAPKILLSAERKGGDWIIRVKDNGVGIAKEDQARIFLPFVRLAARDVPGTGLGLAVCRKIVDGMGGEIWVESEIGAGSTFSFTIAAQDARGNPAQIIISEN
jgi:PAS domain S-box-containing protein